MSAVALVTAVLALPLALVYFERRLPPDTSDLVERQVRGGDFDGAFELGVLVLVATTVGIVFGLAVANRITRAISALSTAARAVAAGDLSARPRVPERVLDGPDELGGLLRDFVAMTESLDRLEAERRADAAAIAHELRTPLAVLQGRLEAARDGVLAVDDAELAVLLQQTRTLARLVGDLKTLSLARAGRLEFAPSFVDLVDVVRDIAQAFGPAADDVGVRVDLRSSSALVLGDRERLGQVVANLLDNALRYGPPGGTVRLHVQTDGPEAHLIVSDSGPGFAPESVDKVFDRFYRADSDRSRATGGSGLGLSVVKALVELHGGSVEARNGARSGAELHVRLPLSPDRDRSG